jgi:hypothetical protein
MKRILIAIGAAITLVLGTLGGIALASGPTVAPSTTIYGCDVGANRTLQNVYTTQANYLAFLNSNGGVCPNGGFEVTVGANGTVTPTPTPTQTTPTPTPTQTTPTPTPTQTTPTPTPTPTAATCTETGLNNASCPLQADRTDLPPSNGYTTYFENQDVGANSGTTGTLTTSGLPATPGTPWFTSTVDAVPLGSSNVQVFANVQQLFTNWGTNGWNGSSATPLASLSALKVNFNETSPQDADSQYEFAADVWSNYQSDVMFWTDTTSGRCSPGGYGGTVLGHVTMDGQNWTVNRYGGAGAEIIFVLDGAGGPGTCARETSGSIDVAAGMNWLSQNGYITSPVTLGQVNSGWEITSADKTNFVLNSYSITATPTS